MKQQAALDRSTAKAADDRWRSVSMDEDGSPAATVREDDFEFRSRRVFDALRALRKLWFRQLQSDLYGEGQNALEPAQYEALDLLLTENEWRMTDYANALRVDPSTATRMVDRLVKAGVAVRTPSRTDGRGVNIRATKAGRLRRIRVEQGRRELMYEVLGDFTNEEIDSFVDFTDRLIDNMGSIADERAAIAAHEKRRAGELKGRSTPGTD